MHFRYDLTFGLPPSDAYEWLLHDAMQGDQTLFARSDWIYEAWSLVDPVMTYWEAPWVETCLSILLERGDLRQRRLSWHGMAGPGIWGRRELGE